MRKLILLLLLCSTFSFFGQTKNAELNIKLDRITAYVKFVDSIASYSDEQILDGIVVVGHSKVNKQIRELLNSTRIIRYSDQIIRICHKQRYPDSNEELSLYFLNGKVVYAERNIWKGRRNKFSTARFYYENEIEIYTTDFKGYPLTGIDILITAKDLVKQAVVSE